MGCKTIGRFVYDNTSAASIEAGGNLPYTNVTVANKCIQCDGQNITIERPGVYSVQVNATSVPAEAGAVELQLYRNGMAIPGAHSIDTVGTAGNNVSSAFNAIITVPAASPLVTLNVRSVNANAIRIANVIVIKEA